LTFYSVNLTHSGTAMLSKSLFRISMKNEATDKLINCNNKNAMLLMPVLLIKWI